MIEKSLYAAPEGLEALDAGSEDSPDGIEIEIVDPEELSIKIGDLEISLGGMDDEDFDENLADVLPEDVIQTIVSELIDDFEDDVSSRKDWMQTYVDGLELLGKM